MDPSTAAAWRDLYIGMVGAGASLTGLTFVAIALDPDQIERTPLLRLRAASALWSGGLSSKLTIYGTAA